MSGGDDAFYFGGLEKTYKGRNFYIAEEPTGTVFSPKEDNKNELKIAQVCLINCDIEDQFVRVYDTPLIQTCVTCKVDDKTFPKKYYDFEEKTCEPCHGNCFECTGYRENQCKKCSSEILPEGVIKYSMVWNTEVDTDQGKCIPDCKLDSGYFLSIVKSDCKVCHSSCNKCIGPLATDC